MRIYNKLLNSRSGVALMTASVSVGVVALLTAVLHIRAEAAKPEAQTPVLPVATTVYQLQDGYRLERRYLGRVEASRSADLGFVQTGDLTRVLVNPGQTVASGELLAQLDDASLQARKLTAEARLRQASAELRLAELDAARFAALVNQGAISQSRADQSRLTVDSLEASVEAIQADISAIEVDLGKTRLRAPFAGTIASRFVDEGAVLNPGTPVLRIVSAEAPEVHIGLPSEKVQQLVPGQTYRVTVRDKQLQAILKHLQPDVERGTLLATATFSMPKNHDTLDGESAQLTLDETVTGIQGGWIPISALTEGQRGLWSVLRVNESEGNPRAERELVEVIAIQKDQAYVRGTLQDGALLISGGLNRVAPGSIITTIGG